MGRDTITLEQAVSTISQEYLQLFCSDYFIPESLHPELPGPEDAIVNFPEGKISSGWMSFAKRPGKDTPQCYVKPLDSLKNWNNRFFWVDERVFPTPVAWRSSAPRDNKPTADSYSEADVATLDTHSAESAATEVPPETNLEQEVLTMGPPVNKRRRKRDWGETVSSAPSKAPRTERDTAADTQSVSEPEPLPFAVPSSKAAAVEDEDKEKSSSFISMGGPPDDIYQPNWGITNSCRTIPLSVKSWWITLFHQGVLVLLRDAPPAFRGLPEPIQHQHGSAGGIGVAA
ncbi:hypothetical protein Tco_0650547 [Tanacetum coccineum]